MRSIMKKASLLAVTALAAAALAAPAGASAAEWTYEGEPITENAEATFHGFLEFSGKFGSMGCETAIETTLEPGGTGTVDAVFVNFSFCQAGGLMASCFLGGSVLNAEELPWAFNPEAGSEIGLSGIRIGSYFGSCPYFKEIIFTGTQTAIADNPAAISSISFNGGPGLETQIGNPVAMEGTLQANFSPPGTYGFE